jgi:Kelch motif
VARHILAADMVADVPERAVIRRRRAVAALVLIAVAALLVWIGWPGNGAPRRSDGASGAGVSRRGRRIAPARFTVRSLPFALPHAVQDAAGSALGRERVALLGGLDASDSSTAAVSVLDGRGVVATARLPEAQHDAQSAVLAGRVYVFGGGQFTSYDHILSYDPATGAVTIAGSLPGPTSDAGVAAVAGTAYVVGGYDGQHPLDTIVAWRPGEPARVVARLPYGLRYAAVASSAGRLVIAGGSRGEEASSTILSFDPTDGRVRRIGTLPQPATHAAAVALGPYVYLLGGRSAAPNSQVAAIVAIDPSTGRSVRAGQLPAPLSDAAAIALGGGIWLAGGLSADGAPVASVLELTPARG